MAKKITFNRDNPALSFISSVTMDTPEAEEAIERGENTQEREEAKTMPAENTQEQFTVPDGYKLVKIEEKRTKRVQLVMQPSLFDKVCDAVSGYRRLSFNDYCHKLLEISVENPQVQELIKKAIEAEANKKKEDK